MLFGELSLAFDHSLMPSIESELNHSETWHQDSDMYT